MTVVFASQYQGATMQILSVSDEVASEIYSPSLRSRFGHVDLVLSCGDLPPSYLEFIVSSLDVPVLYVPGNHDGQPEHTASGQTVYVPLGGVNIDGRVVKVRGLSIAGIGGSIRYNGGRHQYTETQMFGRVMLLLPRLLLRQRRDGHRLDVLITHSPPAGVHDGPRAHRGFQSLVYLLERIKPRYHIHGHVHMSYGYCRTRTSLVGPTTVINTTGYRLLKIEPATLPVIEREHVMG
ncbi:MAG: metallophosphoesterase [Herpetosiphon sp.]